MAKPPIGDLPPPWGGAGNYSVGNYSAQLPWGAANPLAGQPFPWGGQPRLNTTGLTGFANVGHTPQVPDDPSVYNEWLRRVQVHVSWVQDGVSTGAATAHIMETDASGFSSALKYIGQFEGPGSTPADLPLGFDVPAGQASTFGDGSTVTGGVGSVPTWEVYELASEKASTANLQIHHLAGEPRWRDGDDDYIHHGTEPWGPVGSVPALANFGPAIGEIDGPDVEVTLTGTAFLQVMASAVITGTDLSTVSRIKVDIDGVDVYNETFRVFNTDRALSWGTSFHFQKAAGTYTVKIQFSRDSGGGSVNLTSASIIVTPV